MIDERVLLRHNFLMHFSSKLKQQRHWNESGQMAIFVALIFQVLFVFFAMIVNVGLIVHDKINLQNSVDIAAYYGAQRQAEILNAIAHENYQIRQAWKLLSWRIRVLGDLGYPQHPMQLRGPSEAQDISALASDWYPTVCVNHSLWGGAEQNLCKSKDIEIPPLSPTKIIAFFDPINYLIASRVDKLIEVAKNDCKGSGPLNFNLTLAWVKAYRVQIAKSKETIRMYASMLSKETNDFVDLDGKSTKQGAVKTLARNLTRANSKSLEPNNFHFFNSMGVVSGDNKKWLNEVPIYPAIYYTDLWEDKGCKGLVKPINSTPAASLPREQQTEDNSRREPNDINDLYHSVFGVEKNPWMMAYVGVYAETAPRKPYLPFGDPIVLKAKAFAKPFGGRIGPWYYTRWPKGSLTSKGNNDQRTDMMAPIPMDESGNLAASSADLGLGIPNYSRYPGDTLGLKSRAALTSFKEKIYGMRPLQPGFYSGVPNGNDGLAYANESARAFQGMNQRLSILNYPGPPIREIEVAAIAPDLFDITYYSIDLDSIKNYIQKSIDGGLIQKAKAPFDIGSFTDNPKTIATQIDAVKAHASTSAFWMVRDPDHLLTGWAPSGAYKYNFPEEVFGKCIHDSSDVAPVPGKCAIGGRVGYSVKIVSEDYLKSDKLPLGGEGVVGPISNPPVGF